jgi:hypothetical protein
MAAKKSNAKVIEFSTTIKKFKENGEKTGWTYIDVPLDLAEQLNPGCKKSFRVKGKLDGFEFENIALLPMGEGNFILTLNAPIRKKIKKEKGDKLKVVLQMDSKERPLSKIFVECLEDEPRALGFFKTLAKSHQRYFSNWIESAKTEATKAKRITQAVNALAMNLGFSEMVRMNKKDKEMY